MITIFEPTATDFSTNGLGVLEPISCYLNVTINGAWVVEMEHPYDSENKYEKITKDNIIKITNIPIITEQSSSYQLFRVYDVVRTLTTVKAIAFPVAFEATYDAIIEELKTEKKTATATLQDVMTYLNNHGVTKYTVTSDFSMVETVRQRKGNWKNTNLIALISGADDGSIINHWGGEVAYDNYKIIVNGKLGQLEDTMYCNPSYRFASAFWHSQAYESGYHQQDYNYKKATGEDAIIAIDNSHNFMLVSCISPTAVDWVWQRLEYDSASGAWIYGTWQDPIYADQYGLYTPCYRESSFTYKGKTWWVSWGYMDTYYNTPFVTVSHVLDGRSTGDIVGSAKALIDLSGWNAKQPDKYEIRYGKNLTGLSVDVDMSSVVTRLYPISKDGVRLSWLPTPSAETPISYVDSDNIDEYPYIRSAFVEVDNQLIDTSFKVNQVNSDTAIATHTAQTAITNAVRTIASELWSAITEGQPYNTKWYEPEWVQSVIDDVIKTLQSELPNTWSITHPTFKNLIQSCIKEGIEWIKKEDIADFTWDNSLGDWQYTNGSRTLTSQYAFVDRRYCYFNALGNYEPWKDVSEMDWIQGKSNNSKKKYGNNQRYFAKSETVYTMNGDNQDGSTFSQYYFDSDGWWDGNSEESEWNWHQSGNKYWFGDADAGDDENKYAHDCWVYIYNTNLEDPQKALYYFDSDGYMDSEKTTVVNWEWHEKENRYYFGSTTKSQRAVYLTNQWLKVDGTWRKFKDDGTLTDMKTLKTQLTTLLKNAINTDVASVVTAQSGLLYDLLYQELKDYCTQMYLSNRVDLPIETVKVNLVELSKMEGYEDFSQFEQIHLGNAVDIYDYIHNFTLHERIVGLKYDCIRGYNTEVTISEPPKTISQAITGGKSGKLDKINYGDSGGLVAGEGINISNGVIGLSYIPSGDAFQGTQVVVDPDLVSGTKIADIYIDGTPNSLYAPTPTTYSAGANIQISQQGVISATDTTYNDFAGDEHGLVPAVGQGDSGYLKSDGSWDEPEGTAVEANPTGTATDTLSTILIDDTIYDIQGGGGTDVEANPSGEPTDTLLSVKIGNVIYDIPSGEVTTDIKEYAPQKYTFMYESGQDAAFSTLDGDMQIQTVLDPSYSASDYKAEIVRVVPIPTTVKKIRYRLEFGYQTYRESNTDEWKYCVGVKSTLDTTNYASPTDNDFIIKKLYRKEDYENSIIEDELILDGTTQTYLYFIGRGWNCEITKLEAVEVGTVMELSELDDVNITNPSDGQTIVFNGTSGKWENQTPSCGGGSTITYGTSEPSGSANDGDVYYLLKDDKLQATFLYKVNQWILIEGAVGREGVRIWTHSTGGNDASMWMQHGYYNPSTGVFTPDQNEIDVKYQDVYQRETTYYDMVSLYYGNWQCKAKTEMTDGTNTYAVGSMIKSWQYYESVDFTVWRTT